MWKAVLALCLLAGLIYLGNNPITLGGNQLPPIGSFFSPVDGFWNNGRTEIPDEIDISELKAPVDLFIDSLAIPHIFSSNLEDAFRVQGYLHAANRLFQMDATSRFTAGRLSELFGERMEEIDLLMRRRGLPFAAENAVNGWKKHAGSIGLINAYVEGVNSYISSLEPADYPIEYKLINAKPEPWSVYKVACINKSMTFDLCFRNEDDIAAQALKMLGPEMYKHLFPFRRKDDSPVIPTDTDWSYIPKSAYPSTFDVRVPPDKGASQTDMPVESNGSNNWAVSGSKTANGYPILCNDPHLRLRLPSVWYECQINTPDMNVHGVSLPGVPGIIIGFNENVAWGLTNVGMDVLDWHLVKWVDKKAGTYMLDDTVRRAEKRIETIRINGMGEIIDTVLYTRWGPMTYAYDTTHPLHNYSMRWIGHEKMSNDEFATFIGLNKARSVDELISATTEFRSPAQNIVMASGSGDIALRISGALPLRLTSNGEFPVDGSHSQSGWHGFIDQAHNPITRNPDQGFVSSANQITTDSTYPFTYYGYYADFRGRLLNKKLESMKNITVRDMQILQNNNESLLAEEALTILFRATDSAGQVNDDWNAGAQLLRDWNRKFEANAIEPALFIEWFKNFYRLSWDEFDSGMRTPEYWRTINLGIQQPSDAFFDIKKTDYTESANDIALIALKKAVATIDSLSESDNEFNWGKYNANRITHLLNLDAFSGKVNPVNGFKYALNAVSSTHGPSWRMVVELSDPVKAWGIYPGGQSGHPGDPHYDDRTRDWTEGNYYQITLYDNYSSTSKMRGQRIKCNTE